MSTLQPPLSRQNVCHKCEYLVFCPGGDLGAHVTSQHLFSFKCCAPDCGFIAFSKEEIVRHIKKKHRRQKIDFSQIPPPEDMVNSLVLECFGQQLTDRWMMAMARPAPAAPDAPGAPAALAEIEPAAAMEEEEEAAPISPEPLEENPPVAAMEAEEEEQIEEEELEKDMEEEEEEEAPGPSKQQRYPSRSRRSRQETVVVASKRTNSRSSSRSTTRSRELAIVGQSQDGDVSFEDSEDSDDLQDTAPGPSHRLHQTKIPTLQQWVSSSMPPPIQQLLPQVPAPVVQEAGQEEFDQPPSGQEDIDEAPSGQEEIDEPPQKKQRRNAATRKNSNINREQSDCRQGPRCIDCALAKRSRSQTPRRSQTPVAAPAAIPAPPVQPTHCQPDRHNPLPTARNPAARRPGSVRIAPIVPPEAATAIPKEGQDAFSSAAQSSPRHESPGDAPVMSKDTRSQTPRRSQTPVAAPAGPSAPPALPTQPDRHSPPPTDRPVVYKPLNQWLLGDLPKEEMLEMLADEPASVKIAREIRRRQREKELTHKRLAERYRNLEPTREEMEEVFRQLRRTPGEKNPDRLGQKTPESSRKSD